jgi:hypothetical protein
MFSGVHACSQLSALWRVEARFRRNVSQSRLTFKRRFFAPTARKSAPTARVKGKRGNGIRLIDLNSVRAFIEGAPEQPSKKVRIEMARRAFASADARAKNGGEA